MRAMRRHERGKPAAGLAVVASIFATALVIKMLAPVAQPPESPEVDRTLPSRGILVWTATHPSVLPVTPSLPRVTAPEHRIEETPAALPRAEMTAGVRLTFDVDPGEAPRIEAAAFTPVALAPAVAATAPEVEAGQLLLAVPFAKTGSALRLAFAKTGSAIKVAASGTAGVFVPQP